MLTATSLAYWVGFVALWSGEPSIGFDGAIDFVVSIPNVALAATYVSLWLVTSGSVLSGGPCRRHRASLCDEARAGHRLADGPMMRYKPGP